MMCNKCLKEKDKMEFQTDNSYYCNSCIKVFGQPNLMQASQASDKSQSSKQSTQQSKQQSSEQLTIKYKFVQLDSNIENNIENNLSI